MWICIGVGILVLPFLYFFVHKLFTKNKVSLKERFSTFVGNPNNKHNEPQQPIISSAKNEQILQITSLNDKPTPGNGVQLQDLIKPGQITEGGPNARKQLKQILKKIMMSY